MLLDIEQVIAPGKHVPECLLPYGGISCSARQHLQSLSQTGQECLWGEEFDACRCQFNGQRQPIQAHTDLGDGTRIGGSHLDVGPGSLCTLQKECHSCILCQGFALGKLGEVGQRQRWDRKLAFTTDVQYGTTGHQDVELRAVGQQV